MNNATLTPCNMAWPGDIIQDRNGQLYQVKRVKQVNFLVVDEDGREWNFRRTGAFYPPAGAKFNGQEVGKDINTGENVRLKEPQEPFVVGTVVKFRPGTSKFAGPDYVVLRANGDTYSIVKLGGDGGRYVRGVGHAVLEKVDVS